MQQDAHDFAAEMARACMGSRIGRLQRIVGRRFEVALAATGLTPPQLEILAALTLVDQPVPPSTLAQALAVERSTMSRNLALMRERGWIAAAGVSPGGRTMTVAITDTGRTAFAGARDAWEQAQSSVLDALGDDAPAGLDDWLSRLGFAAPEVPVA